MFEENRSISLFPNEMEDMINFGFGNKEQYSSNDIWDAIHSIFNQKSNISNISDDEDWECDFFNKYIKHKFEYFIKINKCGLRFETFPKYFYMEATHRRSRHYLDKTLEELIMNKELYKDDITSQNKYNNNLKVITILKEDKYKNILNENNFDIFLKKKYRDLIKDYLISNEFKQTIKSLKTKIGIKEAEKYEYVAKHLIEYLRKNEYK